MLKDIERRTCDGTILECRHKCCFVDYLSTGGIDEDGRGLHRPKALLIDQVVRIFIVRGMQRDDIALP